MMIEWFLLGITLCFVICWLWWVLPKRLSRNQPNGQASRRLESFYRKNVSQALAGASIMVGILITVEQTVSTQQQATRTSIMQQQQKALEFLGGPSQLSRAVAASMLQALGDEMPKLQKSILFELAGAAVLFSPRIAISAGGAQPANTRPTVTIDAQAALSAIGSLAEMKRGIPLPLARGYFRGVRLPYAYLNGVHLAETDLSGSDLYKAELYGADLRFAILSGANLAGAMLLNAGLVGALLCEDLNDAVPALQTGKPVPVQLAGARLDNANLAGAWLVGIDFGGEHSKNLKDRATLGGADFTGAHLNRVRFGNALLDRAKFQHADLTDVDFSEASIVNIETDNDTKFCNTKWAGGRMRSEGCPTAGQPSRASPPDPCSNLPLAQR